MSHRVRHNTATGLANIERFFTTTYHNATGRPIIVWGSLVLEGPESGTSSKAFVQCRTDSNATPTTVHLDVGFNYLLAKEKNEFGFHFIVQANDYYMIRPSLATGATATLDYWNETHL